MSEGNNMGRGKHKKIVSSKLRGFVTNTMKKLSPSLSQSSSSSNYSSGTSYPIAHFVNCDRFSIRHKNFLAAITSETEPQSFRKAMCDSGWRQAMQNEIRALEKNGTWSTKTLPHGQRALGSKWVYKC